MKGSIDHFERGQKWSRWKKKWLPQTPKRNSPQVVKQVERLDAAIGQMLEEKYRQIVENRLKHPSRHEGVLLERVESAKRNGHDQSSPLLQALQNDLFEFLQSAAFTPEEREAYIARHAVRVRDTMGSSGYVYTMKQRILRDDFDIEWYTPAEEYPEYDFDFLKVFSD